MAKTPTIKELQLQISKLNQSNRALKRHADERLSKLNAIKQELKDLNAKNANMHLVFDHVNNKNKSLKKDIANMHKDFTKLREENEALRKANIINEDGKADKIFQIARVLGIESHTISLNDILETVIVQNKDLSDISESFKNFKKELSKLLSLPETASMADILNAIVALRLKYDAALTNGKKAIQALGLPDHAKESDILEAIEDIKLIGKRHKDIIGKALNLDAPLKVITLDEILNAIDFLKNKYEPAAVNLFKQVCKLFDKNIHTTSVDDIMKLIKTNYGYAHSPFYMEVCDTLKQHHGTRPEMLIVIIKTLLSAKDDNANYIAINKELRSILKIDLGFDITKAIKELKLDLAAAREQEDKNAREVDRLKKLNLELQSHINELGKPAIKHSDFKSIKEIVDEVVKNATKQIFKECSDENFNANDKQTKLEQELREKLDEVIRKCNDLTFENHQVKEMYEKLSTKIPQSNLGKVIVLEAIASYPGYKTNLNVFNNIDSLLTQRAGIAEHYLRGKDENAITLINHLNDMIRKYLGIVDFNK